MGVRFSCLKNFNPARLFGHCNSGFEVTLCCVCIDCKIPLQSSFTVFGRKRTSSSESKAIPILTMLAKVKFVEPRNTFVTYEGLQSSFFARSEFETLSSFMRATTSSVNPMIAPSKKYANRFLAVANSSLNACAVLFICFRPQISGYFAIFQLHIFVAKFLHASILPDQVCLSF